MLITVQKIRILLLFHNVFGSYNRQIKNVRILRKFTLKFFAFLKKKYQDFLALLILKNYKNLSSILTIEKFLFCMYVNGTDVLFFANIF